ncbi:MAG: trypsin-like peptidase domain-containing protein [Bacteriovoracales bacterium]|nr:trypsin-like peptidase domain-containing protein [Bacteriovoracales bacterium]
MKTLKLKKVLGIFLTLSFFCHPEALKASEDHKSRRHSWTEQIRAFKSMVVNIETSSPIVFEDQLRGTSYATGFIVDAKRGIIATNRHVTGVSPSRVKISFYDSSFTEGRVLYYDPTHDFGFYQIDPSLLDFELKAVELGSATELSEGDDLLLIGNNESEEYSIKFGSVANLNVNKGSPYSSYLHTTFDRTGGSSGSPVWNTQGQVVAIHAAGTNTSSFELPIDYLLDTLKLIQRGMPVKRGSIGVDIELIPRGLAVNHFNFPKDLQKNQDITASQGNLQYRTKKVMQIQSLIPTLSDGAILRPSDIISQINGRPIYDNLYLFDAILNQNVGKDVNLEIYRNGKRLHLSVPVSDLESKKVNRYVTFAGAVFHEITPSLRGTLHFEDEGVYLSFAQDGSSFSKIGSRGKSGSYKVVILEINGKRIFGLDDFIAASKDLSDGQYTYLVVRDFNLYKNSPHTNTLTVHSKFSPLREFKWNQKILNWEEVDL